MPSAPPPADRTGSEPPLASVSRVGVTLAGRDRPVLSDVQLQVEAGERLLVLGPSGSGKSTLLATLSGVVPHSVRCRLDGVVQVAGQDTTGVGVAELSRLVASVAQDPSSSVCLPLVEDELALPLENRAVHPADISGRIDEALGRADASALRSRHTGSLSGGELQRVALAAALVADPRLLLDEPTAMLDPAGVSAVRRMIGAASGERSPAVVLVEHRLDDLAGTDDGCALPRRTVALAADGTVLVDAPTHVVFGDYARELHRAGCPLPWRGELTALGVGSTASVRRIRDLGQQLLGPIQGASTSSGRLSGDAVTRRCGPVVLVARRLSVGRPGDRVPVLTGVDLEVRPGEIVAVLGSNGSGKSTLLMTLAGLLPPVEGRVAGPRPGYVTQFPEHGFVAHRVADEIGYGVPRSVRADRVARQLDRHRLAGLARRSPWRLSGGEQRRVSLAAMLAHDREALLLDEPTLGLDRRDTAAMVGAVRQVAAAGGAVVVASHDLRVVAEVAHRVVVVAGGRVVADGPTMPVLTDRVVRRVAGLVLPPAVRWATTYSGESSQAPALLAGLSAA